MESQFLTQYHFNRERVHINLNQLLQKNKIDLPEETLKNKLRYKYMSKDNSQTKQPVKLHIRSRSSNQFEKQQNLSIFHNNRIYQKFNAKTNSNFRGWSPQKSAELVKRSTMPNFRYSSLNLQQRHSKSNMWRPVHYRTNSNTIENKQSKEKAKSDLKSEQNTKLKKQQYLKKGSDINKRVVVNLLKLKVGKTVDHNEEEDSTIRNFQILRMIKIYKGYGQSVQQLRQEKSSGVRLIKDLQLKQKQNSQEQELKIRKFPFQNVNIQLSVSKWNQGNQLKLYSQHLNPSI